MPLKEGQIKVTKRDKVLIKLPEKKPTKAEEAMAARYYGMGKKKENFKEYDLKTSQVIEVRKKPKKYVNSSSESESDE